MKVTTAQEMERIDNAWMQACAIPQAVLMENAAMGVTQTLISEGAALRGQVLILCGMGNNGADGLAVARQLSVLGYEAVALIIGAIGWKDSLIAERAMLEHTDVQTDILAEGAPLELLKGYIHTSGVIVDALFGTGLSRELKGTVSDVIRLVNDSGKPVYSIDMPSGVDATTGRVLGEAVFATATITMQYIKQGQLLFPGRSHVGRLIVHPIAPVPREMHDELPTQTLSDEDAFLMLPIRRPDAHKGMFGRLAVIAGSVGFAGAGLFTAKAALSTGAGLVTMLSSASMAGVYQSAIPEAMFAAIDFSHPGAIEEFCGKCNACVIGPGCGGPYVDVGNVVNSLLKLDGLSVVVDADGLNALAEVGVGEISANAVFTPHIGEMARLTKLSIDNLLRDPIGYAREYAKRYNAVIVLKSASTVIAEPGGRACITTSGCSAMAKGGSGDVLSGMIAALLAQGLAPYAAAALGSYLHGKAGSYAAAEKGEYSVLPLDIVNAIGQVMG